jgi:hypothetical protein
MLDKRICCVIELKKTENVPHSDVHQNAGDKK